ncbi:NAD(P)-binding protein [Schizophyllum commune Tattone D]|nr:NAD(P)-binding protein [Schizophyllum commune Tattone D]
MPAGFKSIAVAGAQSSIGKPAVQALASTSGVSVLVLTRKTTPRPDWLPAGVAHAGVDYDDVDGTAAVLREHKVEVVLAPITTTAVLQQIPLANAAKAAGVQLFVPSEFGTISKGWKKEEVPAFLAPKIQVAEHLESIGLPSLRVFTGVFEEFITTLVGYNSNKRVNILKSLGGDQPFSTTATADIGGFVAHVVTHYPASELSNKALRIQGDELTLNGLGTILNTPVEKVDEVPAPAPGLSGFLADLQSAIDRGLLSKDKKVTDNDGAGGANHLWEGHRWTTVKEFLKL